jgi:hypothetical protein
MRIADFFDTSGPLTRLWADIAGRWSSVPSPFRDEMESNSFRASGWS